MGRNVKNVWQEVRKIVDVDLYEERLTGGIFYIAKRYAKANNKYMKDYDPKKPSKCVTYLDMNHLHGWTMSRYLPYFGFK